MAKAKLNDLLAAVSGRIGNLVVKQYAGGVVLSKMPDMSRVKPSARQKARREWMRLAGIYYRKVMGNEIERARFEALRAETGLPLPALTLREFARWDREQPVAGPGTKRERLPPVPSPAAGPIKSRRMGSGLAHCGPHQRRAGIR